MRHLFLILMALPLAAACGTEEGEQNAAELANVAAEAGNNAPAAPSEAQNLHTNSQAVTTAPKILTVGPLQVRYDGALLAPVPVKIQLPPDWQREVDAVKLIGSDRAALIGKAECMYGQSGQASRCNASQEAGLAFATLPAGFAEASAAIPAAERQKISMAGAEGVSWQIGAEGEGAEHILLPAGDRTLLIVRHFRSTGNPDEAALGAVLNGLRMGE